MGLSSHVTAVTLVVRAFLLVGDADGMGTIAKESGEDQDIGLPGTLTGFEFVSGQKVYRVLGLVGVEVVLFGDPVDADGLEELEDGGGIGDVVAFRLAIAQEPDTGL